MGLWRWVYAFAIGFPKVFEEYEPGLRTNSLYL
jgi:hypothetical protein